MDRPLCILTIDDEQIVLDSVIKHLRKDNYDLLTAISTALKATHLGAFDYIAKPFTRPELLSVVNRAAQLVRTTKGYAIATVIGCRGQYCWRLKNIRRNSPASGEKVDTLSSRLSELQKLIR